MHSTIATALTLAGAVSAIPMRLSTRDIATFPAGMSWDIIEDNSQNEMSASSVDAENVQAFDLDLLTTSKDTITSIKATNTRVICYFSAGSREDWRADASKFTSSDYGQGLDGWAGENWVNVKSDNVKAIMKARIQTAKDNGCDAIDPDNVDGYQDNQDGFGYDMSAYSDYVKFLASEASALGMATGLKNAIDMIPSVIDSVAFAVNEECHANNECDGYKAFTSANKAVFNIEYGLNDCTSPSGVKLSTLIKGSDQSTALQTMGGQCPGQGAASASGGASSPAASATASATAKATATAKAVTTSSSVAKASVTPSTIPVVVPTSVASASVTSSAVLSGTKTRASATPTATGHHHHHHDDDDDDDDNDDDDDDN